MIYEVKCASCGARFERRLFGPEKNRAAILDQPQICGTCHQKRMARERAAAAANAANAAIGRGLPPLAGSEKQVAWAFRIRAAALESADEFIGHIRGADPAAARELEELFQGAFGQLTSASWWIDNRSSLERYKESITKIAYSHPPLLDYLRAKGLKI